MNFHWIYLIVALVSAGRLISWTAWTLSDAYDQKRPDGDDWTLGTMLGILLAVIWPIAILCAACYGLVLLSMKFGRAPGIRAFFRGVGHVVAALTRLWCPRNRPLRRTS